MQIPSENFIFHFFVINYSEYVRRLFTCFIFYDFIYSFYFRHLDCSVTCYVDKHAFRTADIYIIEQRVQKRIQSGFLGSVLSVSNSGSYTMTGDVTNAGVTDATGMILTPGSPATPVEPYSSYAVGSLTSNDFSSFTLTFTASDLSAVPVIVQWKDAAGNSFKTTTTLDLRSLAAGTGTGSRSGSGGSSGATSSATGGASAQAGGAGAARGGGGLFSFGGGRGGGLSAFYPLIAGALVIIIAIVLWIKRKWIVAKFRKQ